jgi:hypothetical protein
MAISFFFDCPQRLQGVFFTLHFNISSERTPDKLKRPLGAFLNVRLRGDAYTSTCAVNPEKEYLQV